MSVPMSYVSPYDCEISSGFPKEHTRDVSPNAHAPTHTHAHTYIRWYIHIHIHEHAHVYLHTQTHTYIHTYIRIYIHAYTHKAHPEQFISRLRLRRSIIVSIDKP